MKRLALLALVIAGCDVSLTDPGPVQDVAVAKRTPTPIVTPAATDSAPQSLALSLGKLTGSSWLGERIYNAALPQYLVFKDATRNTYLNCVAVSGVVTDCQSAEFSANYAEAKALLANAGQSVTTDLITSAKSQGVDSPDFESYIEAAAASESARQLICIDSGAPCPAPTPQPTPRPSPSPGTCGAPGVICGG